MRRGKKDEGQNAKRMKVKRTMVKCKAPGCKRLVFPEQEYCWEHKLKRRDEKVERIKKGR